MKKMILITSFFIAVMLLMPIAAVATSNTKIGTQIEKNSDNCDKLILNVNNNGPCLEIIYFDGSRIIIKNTGDVEAVNVEWSIKIDGPLVLIGGYHSGTISSILPGEQVERKLGFIFGFGPVTVKATVSAENGGYASASESGFLLLIFIM